MSSITLGIKKANARKELFLGMLSEHSGKPVSEIDLEKDTFESLGIADPLGLCDMFVMHTRKPLRINDFDAPLGKIFGPLIEIPKNRNELWGLLGPAISKLAGKDVSEIKESDKLWDLGLRPGAGIALTAAVRKSVRVLSWEEDTVKDILDRMCAA